MDRGGSTVLPAAGPAGVRRRRSGGATGRLLRWRTRIEVTVKAVGRGLDEAVSALEAVTYRSCEEGPIIAGVQKGKSHCAHRRGAVRALIALGAHAKIGERRLVEHAIAVGSIARGPNLRLVNGPYA